MLWFRADMNEKIASGHVMRCLSIADAAKNVGEESIFIVSDSNPQDIILSRGYKCIVLNSKWDDLDQELPLMHKLIAENNIKKLVVDSYYASIKYLNSLSESTNILFIDDMNIFNPDVKSILCYSNHYRDYNFDESKGIKYLLGPKYTPLRKQFINVEKKEIKYKVESLLILSRGTTSIDFLREILLRIIHYNFKRIDVVIGVFSKSIIGEFENSGVDTINFHYNINDIDVYMKNADLTISAGGTTIYELCACGTPTISYSLAENQVKSVISFSEEGIIPYSGDLDDKDTINNIFNNLDILINDFNLRKKIASKMQSKVDGKGALRIVNFLMNEL